MSYIVYGFEKETLLSPGLAVTPVSAAMTNQRRECVNLRLRKLFPVAPAALSEASTRITDIANIPTVMASSVDIQSISPRGLGI